MTFTAASSGSLFCFLLIIWAVIGAVLYGVRRAKIDMMKFALGLAAWLFSIALVVKSGFLAEAPMPRLPAFMAMVNLVGIAVAMSSVGKKLASALPIALLLTFQGFRLPLELVLHSWVEQGVIPPTMSWNGSNFDILSGMLCFIAAPAAQKNRSVAWICNIVGLALLLNVMRVAIFSSPLPFAWDVSPPLLLAFQLPYALILPVCVTGALFGHLVLTRKLLTMRAE